MVNLFVNGNLTKYKKWKFPGGEVGIQLEDETLNILRDVKSNVEVVVEGLHNTEDVFTAGNLLDATKNVRHSTICTLTFKYLPYARQDRYCSEGESFALQVFMRMINAFNFNTLKLYDPHNEVFNMYLSDNKQVVVIKQHELTKGLPNYDWIVAPDKGASYKAQLTQPDANHIFLNKVRKDGKVVYEDLKRNSICGKVCVVDDIFDAGATFVALAEMLQRTQPYIEQLDLFCSHGIFSKGVTMLDSLYDKVYTFNLMNDNPEVVKRVKRVEVLSI